VAYYTLCNCLATTLCSCVPFVTTHVLCMQVATKFHVHMHIHIHRFYVRISMDMSISIDAYSVYMYPLNIHKVQLLSTTLTKIA